MVMVVANAWVVFGRRGEMDTAKIGAEKAVGSGTLDIESESPRTVPAEPHGVGMPVMRSSTHQAGMPGSGTRCRLAVRRMRRLSVSLAAVGMMNIAAPGCARANVADLLAHSSELQGAFAQEVDRRLDVPATAQRSYAERLQRALAAAKVPDLANQYVVAVDRNPNVQALFLFWRGNAHQHWQMVGASPVSTGMPGKFEHFITPLGVFLHTPENMDYRAEGTKNENGIRGYGAKGMRVYDFGWQQARRGWGKPASSAMRFQMHATDPDRLEFLLGERHSKGCVRIPATLNAFLDRHGVLDAEYEKRQKETQSVAVLHGDRKPVKDAGRYLVVLDSGAEQRPSWSPDPKRHGDKYKDAVANDTAD